MAILGCPGGAVDDGRRVELVGNGFGVVADAGVTAADEAGVVGAEFVVEAVPVGRGQAAGFAHDQPGAGLGEHPAFQGSEGVGQVVDEDAGVGEVLTAVGR